MEIVYLLVMLAIVLVAIIIPVLLWAVRSGQFDDLEGPAHQILMDDDGLAEERDQAEKQRADGGDPDTPHQ